MVYMYRYSLDLQQDSKEFKVIKGIKSWKTKTQELHIFQAWDVTTREYEGNFYHDPSVKDTRNPNLHNHNGRRINHLVVSEDGSYLATAGVDGATCVWDIENEVVITTYMGHTGEVSTAFT